MPVSKNASARYKIINRKLIKGKYASLEELAIACSVSLRMEISTRTIKDDIHELRTNPEYLAPIKYRHGRGYFYEDMNYSIDRLPIDNYDLNALSFAVNMLEQYGDVEIIQNFSRAVENIRRSVGILKKYKHSFDPKCIAFDRPPATVGIEHLPVLLEAANNKIVVFIRYQAFGKDKAVPHILHPYLLKEFQHRWYIFGYEEHWKGYRVYAMDRIKEVKFERLKTFIPYAGDPRDYFEDIYGVSKFTSGPPPRVVLRFTRSQADYVLTQPIHHTQEVIEKTKDHVTISLNVHSTPGLEIKIAGWTDGVEVLAPDDLREKIYKRLENAARKYNQGPPV